MALQVRQLARLIEQLELVIVELLARQQLVVAQGLPMELLVELRLGLPLLVQQQLLGPRLELEEPEFGQQ